MKTKTTLEERISEIFYDDDGKEPYKATLGAFLSLFASELKAEKLELVERIKMEIIGAGTPMAPTEQIELMIEQREKLNQLKKEIEGTKGTK